MPTCQNSKKTTKLIKFLESNCQQFNQYRLKPWPHICMYLQKTWQVRFLHWRHATLCPPCGMGHGWRIHLIYHWLIHLSEPGHVISLSIHPTCSKHKFPFSVQGQLAGMESRRRFLPISVRPIKIELATLTLPSGKGGRGVWGLAGQ